MNDSPISSRALPLPRLSPVGLLADRHRNIEEVLEDVEELARRRSFTTASKRFGELYRAIDEHVQIEEDFWLPRIETAWPERGERLEAIRADHQDLRRQMASVASAITAAELAEVERAIEALKHLLATHHAREEAEIYPAVVMLQTSGRG